MNKEMTVVRNDNIVKRQIHECVFLIDITENYTSDSCHLYELNDIGQFIWDRIGSPKTIKELALDLEEALTDDVPIEELTADIEDFVNQLIDSGLVLGG